MKNLKFLSMMLMLMVGLISFSACDDDDDNSFTDKNGNPSIVGTWKYDSRSDKDWTNEDRIIVQSITFKNNMEGEVKIYEKERTQKEANYMTSFIYSLTWSDRGVGSLSIRQLEGYVFNLTNETYTLNNSAYGDYLAGNTLQIGGRTYKRQ